MLNANCHRLPGRFVRASAAALLASSWLCFAQCAYGQFLGSNFLTGNASGANAATSSRRPPSALVQMRRINPRRLDSLPTRAGTFSAALGGQSLASGQSSTAVGNLSRATANHTAALGQTSIASGLNATAIGSFLHGLRDEFDCRRRWFRSEWREFHCAGHDIRGRRVRIDRRGSGAPLRPETSRRPSAKTPMPAAAKRQHSEPSRVPEIMLRPSA